MKLQRQRGVALVITLIMLSVVTVMAVVFLGISRRERFSVAVTGNQTAARLAADAGLARAQSELLSRIAASNNLSDFDYFVSTNYVNRDGFISGLANVENVAYTYANGAPLTLDDLRLNLGNLFLDPRPPVFIRTNKGPTVAQDQYDFRFFLDLNRNGLFETNGWVNVMAGGQPTLDPFSGLLRTNFLWGDPEWVGVLEQPDLVHSSSNRFIARYAYVAMPAGRSLNLNYIHNQSKELRLRGAVTASREALYNRNQSVGAHELNLAAFLRAWLPTYYPWTQYGYQPELLTAHSGFAFMDAMDIFKYRHGMDPLVPRPMNLSWPIGSAVRLSQDPVDYYAANVYRYQANGDRFSLLPLTAVTNDPITAPFPGGEGLREYRTVSELFDPARTGTNFTGRLMVAGALDPSNSNPPQPDTTNRYAFYRLISQMGTDSIPAARGRVNLNFVNGTWDTPNVDPAGNWRLGGSVAKGKPQLFAGDILNPTNWNATVRGRHDFLMLAADAIIKETMKDILPNGLEDGIQIYPTNFYSGAVHRAMQLAVNLLDANEMPFELRASRELALDPSVVDSSDPDAKTSLVTPTVFRPIFDWDTAGGNRVLKIMGYQEVTNAAPLRLARWLDPSNPLSVSQVVPGDNLYGVPWVVGVEKGWPSFNEFYYESQVLVTRRMRATKPTPASTAVTFQQGYEIGVSNVFGLESWNAYTQNVAFASGQVVSLFFTNVTTMALVDSNRLASVGGRQGLVMQQGPYPVVGTNLVLNLWDAREFRVFTNEVAFIPRSSYLPGRAASPLMTNVSGVFYDPSPGYAVPDWHLEVTNRLLYAATVPVNGEERIVDLVTLNPLVCGFHVQRFMGADTNAFGSSSLDPGRFWLTNRLVNSINSMTAGITNQLFVSTNDVAARADWSNWSEDPVSGMQRERAIDEFRMFMGLPPLFDMTRTKIPAVSMQVPFTPARRLLQRMSWQANDPLVHYTFDDLYSTELANPTNVVPIRPSGGIEGYTPGLPNLGEVNTRYSPWGGRANKQLSGQTAAYNPALQDPGLTQADDYELSRSAMANVGAIGRVPRGTAWQTVYLKSGVAPLMDWVDHAGETPLNMWSHPTNDWKLVDIFTTAVTESMTQGLLSVNQTNEAAWAAVFGGMRVFTNTVSSLNPGDGWNYSRSDSSAYLPLYIDPDVELRASDQFYRLVLGINTNRMMRPSGQYQTMGEILSAPVLTDQSPYLNLAGMQVGQARVNDAVYEAIPRQMLGLVRKDEPYFVVYSYGQALKPAERSLVLTPGPFFNLCTNYQIVGEVLTKTGFRIERSTAGTNVFYNAVVEDFEILPVD
ncbi:MAG: hypothetical protein ACO34E_02220 [Limisphaerales bacterium]